MGLIPRTWTMISGKQKISDAKAIKWPMSVLLAQQNINVVKQQQQLKTSWSIFISCLQYGHAYVGKIYQIWVSRKLHSFLNLKTNTEVNMFSGNMKRDSMILLDSVNPHSRCDWSAWLPPPWMIGSLSSQLQWLVGRTSQHILLRLACMVPHGLLLVSSADDFHKSWIFFPQFGMLFNNGPSLLKTSNGNCRRMY